MAGGNFGGGNGTVGSPYLVEDAQDLNAIRDITSTTAFFEQTGDIDMSVYENFVPIPSFQGTYDGSGFSISNLKISRTDNYTGLFASLLRSGKLYRINLKNAIVNGANNTGSLVGTANTCVIWDCSSENAKVSGAENVGGLVGASSATSYYDGSIKRCWSSGEVLATAKNVGGLIGNGNTNNTTSNTPIEDCYSLCNVVGTTNVGGFAGDFGPYNSTLINCYSSGNVTGVNSVGGFIGTTNSPERVINSFSFCRRITRLYPFTGTNFGDFFGNRTSPLNNGKHFSMSGVQFIDSY